MTLSLSLSLLSLSLSLTHSLPCLSPILQSIQTSLNMVIPLASANDIERQILANMNKGFSFLSCIPDPLTHSLISDHMMTAKWEEKRELVASAKVI